MIALVSYYIIIESGNCLGNITLTVNTPIQYTEIVMDDKNDNFNIKNRNCFLFLRKS